MVNLFYHPKIMQTTIPLEDIKPILEDFEENRLNPGMPEFPALETKAERLRMLRRVYWAIAIQQGKTLATVNQERGELLPEEYVKTSDPIDATMPDQPIMQAAIAAMKLAMAAISDYNAGRYGAEALDEGLWDARCAMLNALSRLGVEYVESALEEPELGHRVFIPVPSIDDSRDNQTA